MKKATVFALSMSLLLINGCGGRFPNKVTSIKSRTVSAQSSSSDSEAKTTDASSSTPATQQPATQQPATQQPVAQTPARTAYPQAQTNPQMGYQQTGYQQAQAYRQPTSVMVNPNTYQNPFVPNRMGAPGAPGAPPMPPPNYGSTYRPPNYVNQGYPAPHAPITTYNNQRRRY